MATLSIIVPFYNEVTLLPMAVESVLSQPIDDVELLIINDNPEAYSSTFFDRWTVDPRVRLIMHEQNRGLSAARNSGIDNSNGAWIGFLDSDDYYVDGGLARQLEYAKITNADMTHAQFWRRAMGQLALAANGRENSLFPGPRTIAGFSEAPAAQFVNSSWCSLYSSEFLERVRLRYDPEQTKYEDRLFVLGAITQAHEIAFLGKPTRVYRKRGISITTKPATRQDSILKLDCILKCQALMDSFANGNPERTIYAEREKATSFITLLSHHGLLSRLGAAHLSGDGEITSRASKIVDGVPSWNHISCDPVIARSPNFKRVKEFFGSRNNLDSILNLLRDREFEGAAALAEKITKGGDRGSIRNRARVWTNKINKDLVLHIGLHKTGTTYLQREFQRNVGPLAAAGILFPQAGLPNANRRNVRYDGFQGHGGLLRPLRKKVPTEEDTWRELFSEVEASDADTVLISSENLLAPFHGNRQKLHSRLADRVSRFRDVKIVAFIRRPDNWIEALYGERVIQGAPEAELTLGEFVFDFGPTLLNLPELFSPLEQYLERKIEFLDYDAIAQTSDLLTAFWSHVGKPEIAQTLRPSGNLVYASPGSEVILAAHQIGRLVHDQEKRRAALQGFFSALTLSHRAKNKRLLSLEERLILIDLFCEHKNYAAERGYAPDFEYIKKDLRANPPPHQLDISSDLLDRAIRAAERAKTPKLEENAEPVNPSLFTTWFKSIGLSSSK